MTFRQSMTALLSSRQAISFLGVQFGVQSARPLHAASILVKYAGEKRCLP